MTVEEMLDKLDSKELTEWRAYERMNGPIDRFYEQDMLAHIQEQLQFLCRITGAQYEENPAPQPKPMPRPQDIYDPVWRERHQQEEKEMTWQEADHLFDN